MPSNDEDVVLEQNARNFAEILLVNGCSHSVPFQHIQNLSSALISFFGNVFRNNSFTGELEYELQHIIRTPEIFNRFIEANFGAIFHKIINIANTDEFFAYMPFKKSFFKLASQFSNFDELLLGSFNTENLLFSMPFNQEYDENIIGINIFIDDFQLCNPLLSKKSQKNSMTGIYYRIVSGNKFKFSSHKFVYLLGLCYSDTFKHHSDIILHYIATQVNSFSQKICFNCKK